jgi:hypothetical protein
MSESSGSDFEYEYDSVVEEDNKDSDKDGREREG